MDLNKDDYKRFETLLSKMFYEESEKVNSICSQGEMMKHRDNARAVSLTLDLIKERQTLKDTHASTSTRTREDNNQVPAR